MAGENIKQKSKTNIVGYVFFFVLFFIAGSFLGIYCTQKYLEDKEEESPIVESSDQLQDITENADYSNLISDLSSKINTYSMFYTTTGMNSSLMSREQKVKYAYDVVLANTLYTEENINALWYGSDLCENDFLVENIQNADGSTYTTGACTLKRIAKSSLVESYQKVFNAQDIDLSSDFIVNDNTKCVVSGEDFLCGFIHPVTGITGELVPKFSIQKVLKDDDETIYIYEKGYLQDLRSNIQNSDDGHEKYYLHSSDSTEYYYELKSADNITFMHTFKIKPDNSYYYVSTEVVKN